ncbi:hypothetical protein ACU60T_25045 [Klebsiella aerogenes]
MRHISVPLLMLALALKSTLALAVGMVPETSLLLLPGQSIIAKAGRSLSGDRQVTFYPASRYGVQVPSYTADVR